MLLLSGSVAFSWELSFDGKPKRALRLDYMARSRRQGRTPLYPRVSTVDRARFARDRTALRKARLECACLVQESGRWSPRHLLGVGTIVQAWLELRIQIQAKLDKRFVFGGSYLSRKDVFTKKGNVHGVVNMVNRCTYRTEQTAKDNWFSRSRI
jgi:hypothetical protein